MDSKLQSGNISDGQINNIINWGELSRLLVNNRSSITKKRIPKKHAATIDRLKELIQKWDDERRSLSSP